MLQLFCNIANSTSVKQTIICQVREAFTMNVIPYSTYPPTAIFVDPMLLHVKLTEQQKVIPRKVFNDIMDSVSMYYFIYWKA